jgi:hypothetical protein
MEAVNDAAFFDVANHFRGRIAGCHDDVRRRRLLQDIQCLDPNKDLSPSQLEAIERVMRRYFERSRGALLAVNRERRLL